MNNYESSNPNVSHPSHYALIPSKQVEVLDVIEAATKDLVGIEAVDTANVIKYILRWNKKGSDIRSCLQDVEKALYYLTHLKNHLMEEIKELNGYAD